MHRSPFLVAAIAAVSLVACSDRDDPAGPVFDGRPASAALARASVDHDLIIRDVTLPGVGPVDLHGRVYVDEARAASSCENHTGVAVHGYAHTAATMAGFAEALFDAPSEGVCRLVALDFPGRGGSGAGAAGAFSGLALEHYVAALLGALERLPAYGIEPRLLVGHSQGGLVIQMAQNALVAAGTGLRERFGIREVALLAPVPAQPVDWAFAGAAVGLLQAFGTFTPELGVHIRIPDGVWPGLFFVSPAGQPAAGIPSLHQVVARGYNAPEPLTSSFQLVTQRPAVAAGIFAVAHGTRLRIVGFEQDVLVRPAELAQLFDHLTAGAPGGGRIGTVTGPEAVHDMYISSPRAAIGLMQDLVP
ncbi:MAG TPA: alpha/beta fold hydrolase [Solirubrobacteraceae bacterium]|nr:alpha/beta fold hydrolase [Solirubrobacteraceae bacterium]